MSILQRIFRNVARFSATSIRAMSSETSTTDTFGTLSSKGYKRLNSESTQRFFPEDSIGYDIEEYDVKPRKNAYFYKYEISKYARQGKVGLRRALELFKEMKSEARLTPTLDNFSPLIHGCAKVGYTQRAFELLQECLNYYNKPTKAMVTSLINSCAESPFPEYGLERLNWFLDHIKIDFGIELNKTQYTAAIKAYGKLGRLDRASELVSEMIKNNIFPGIEVFNMLLVGCASHREAGTTLALKVFKRLKQYDLRPNVDTYNLLLRCIRDCGIGSEALLRDTLAEFPAMTSLDQRLKYKAIAGLSSGHGKILSITDWVPLMNDLGLNLKTDLRATALSSPSSDKQLTVGDQQKIVPATSEVNMMVNLNSSTCQHALTTARHIPNLLSEDHLELFNRIQAIDVEKLTNRRQRLLLFGGIHGYLKTMDKDKCKPNNKSFSLLLACIGSSKNELMSFFTLTRDYSIDRDIVLYNQLIKQVCLPIQPDRHKLASFFIDEMNKDGIRQDIETFEALSIGCHTWHKAKQMIEDVRNCGFVVSDTMLDNFLLRAAKNYDFYYLNSMISLCNELKYQPTKEILEKLEQVRLQAYDIVLNYEKGKLKEVPNWLTDSQVKQYYFFKLKFHQWIKNTSIRENVHPWSQLNVANESKKSGFKKYVKDMKVLIEGKHAKEESDHKVKFQAMS